MRRRRSTRVRGAGERVEEVEQKVAATFEPGRVLLWGISSIATLMVTSMPSIKIPTLLTLTLTVSVPSWRWCIPVTRLYPHPLSATVWHPHCHPSTCSLRLSLGRVPALHLPLTLFDGPLLLVFSIHYTPLAPLAAPLPNSTPSVSDPDAPSCLDNSTPLEKRTRPRRCPLRN